MLQGKAVNDLLDAGRKRMTRSLRQSADKLGIRVLSAMVQHSRPLDQPTLLMFHLALTVDTRHGPKHICNTFQVDDGELFLNSAAGIANLLQHRFDEAKDKLLETHEIEEQDWRPDEIIPEDYHA